MEVSVNRGFMKEKWTEKRSRNSYLSGKSWEVPLYRRLLWDASPTICKMSSFNPEKKKQQEDGLIKQRLWHDLMWLEHTSSFWDFYRAFIILVELCAMSVSLSKHFAVSSLSKYLSGDVPQLWLAGAWTGLLVPSLFWDCVHTLYWWSDHGSLVEYIGPTQRACCIEDIWEFLTGEHVKIPMSYLSWIKKYSMTSIILKVGYLKIWKIK